MSPDAAPLVRARGVTKRFGRLGMPALDHIDLEVHSGRMTGLVGPDGSGKTTMIRALAGLIDPDSGDIDVLGRPARRVDRHDIGYMPQRFGLYEDLTVLENFSLYADMHALEGAKRHASIDRSLKFTDLQRFQGRLAGALSGGMKQKLGLACAMLCEPRLLLLDEPSVGVDPVSRRELWNMVHHLIADGVGVVWSTAYLDEAERCDDVHLLHEGKLLYSGPPAALSSRAAGRVYRVPVGSGERRARLRRALDGRDVRDGVIQGDSLRFLLKPGVPVAAALGDLANHAESVPPRFEDAFIDVLGGGPRGTSRLAEDYRSIPDTGSATIVADGLTKSFGDFTAAADIRFQVSRGQIFGLLGPNGAGKSTTFKMLCGLLAPTSGTGSVAGHDLRTARADARQSLGYMAQKFSLYGDLSVRQNLQFFSGAYGLGGRAQQRSIERMIEIFHLQPFLKDNSGTLPLGFKQRLALACAVMHEPAVLFLDEPTSGVDPIVRREFWAHINGLVEKGVTVLVTTHFMDEAEYCDRIALIYRARTIALGSPAELKARARPVGGSAEPSLEDAFMALIEEVDQARRAA